MALSSVSGLTVAPPTTGRNCSITTPIPRNRPQHTAAARVVWGGSGRGDFCVRAAAVEKLGIVVERNPDETKLSRLGVNQWPKWGCPPSKFPWTYSNKETCYLLKGKVKVTPAGAAESVEIQAGDLVVFPEGMSCTWDVSETVDKHYKFG